MIKHNVKQNSPEWFELRAGKITASAMDALVSHSPGKGWNVRKGDGPATYIYRLIAERWTGRALAYFGGSHAMDQGSMREDDAIPWFELERGVTVERVGFVEMAAGSGVGCSPDGLLPAGGIEVKCPEPTNHVRWLLGGVCPEDHIVQVQACMYVCRVPKWTFLSYRPGFPKLLVDVTADAEAMLVIDEACSLALARIEDGVNKLRRKQ